jgi:PAS domain S-box-containing protein
MVTTAVVLDAVQKAHTRINLSLLQKGMILISVPLVFELIFVLTLSGMLRQAEAEIQQERTAKKVIDKTNQLARLFYQTSVRMKDLRFADADEQNKAFDELGDAITANATELKELTKPLPTSYQLALRIDAGLMEAHRKLSGYREHLGEGSALEQEQRFKEVRLEITPIVQEVAKDLQALIEHEKQIVEKDMPRLQAESRSRVETLLGVGIVFNILLAVFLALFFTRGTVSRLQVLVENTQRLATGRPLNPLLPGKDEIAHLDKVFNDMASALAAAMRKERAILENAFDVICSIDSNGKFISVSPACERLLGYQQRELIGKDYIDLVVEADRPQTIAAVLNVVSTPGGQFENRLIRHDGTAIDVLWSVQWSKPEQSLFCVIHDITQRKIIERMKQEFVSMVSHDLRTPLTSVQAAITLLLSGAGGELSSNGTEILNMADDNISRLIALINDLLDIEKMESGKLQLNIKPTSLQAVFDSSVNAVQGFARTQRIGIEVKPTDLEVDADGDRIVQILVNLVSNAIKFSPKDSTVTIEAVGSDASSNVEVRVIDRGRGVPEEQRKTIFDRFQQVDANDAVEKQGSGLGLAICKAIVEGHGGTIGVNPGDGGGSIFWFKLPAASDTASGAAADEPGDPTTDMVASTTAG